MVASSEELIRQMSDAVCRGNESKILTLLSQGANPNQKVEPYGWTPLHQAAREGNLAICKLLVKHGADLNIRDMTGQTPLHRSAHWGKFDVTKFLVENGADLFVIDSVNQIPEEVAFYFGHTTIFRFLLETRIKVTKSRASRAKSYSELDTLSKQAKKIHKMQLDLEKKEKELSRRNTQLAIKKKELTEKVRRKSVSNDNSQKKSMSSILKIEKEIQKIDEEVRYNNRRLEAARAVCFEEYCIEDKGEAWINYINGKYFE